MGKPLDDPSARVDPLLDSAAREGLTGTTPASAYKPLPVRDQITLPPDGRAPEAQPAWRQDFPIDWPQDQYVARRDFAKFLVLTSGAFVAGQAWIGAQSALRRHGGDLPVLRVVALNDLPVGSSIVFDYPGPHHPCLLIRPSAEVLLSYSQSCTHLSCAVVPRIEEKCLHCPCHNGCFDLETGRPVAGPPRRPLPKILVEVRDGVVYATGIERRAV